MGGLVDTPLRAAKALKFLTSGYDMQLAHAAGTALFPLEDGELEQQPGGMVVVKDISVHSLCEHHLIPFFGRAHIGYLPGRAVLGLSKLARITDFCARRLQMQERLTRQIADALEETAQPRGVAVVLECSHLCMCARGVRQTEAVTRTSTMAGEFATDASLRNEFWSHLSSARL